jgi:hypothetical protein
LCPAYFYTTYFKDSFDELHLAAVLLHCLEGNAHRIHKLISLLNSLDGAKYVDKLLLVMSRDQNAGQSHDIKNDNSYFKRVEEFIYLVTTLTNQNSIQEKVRAD